MIIRHSAWFLLAFLGSQTGVWAVTGANTVEQYLQASRAAGKTSNRLIDELSPYLLQHAYNPVHWYAWGEEAFARAKKEDKPIFLSIGYSTCHWCHVMAHESFENQQIASILNQHFISIKIDREERPDIDAVYMSATQLLNGQGGWPMTVFINHDLEPFFAGTYYPPESVDGHRGLKEILIELQRLWKQDRQRVELVADNIAAVITASADRSLTTEALDSVIDSRALKQIALSFDEEHGGFGHAPKFPAHGIIAFLARLAEQQHDDAEYARRMLEKTLTAMAHGGIYDQVGGGFHRYSVDSQWRVPHFEKMLYSQALLADSYTQVYKLVKQPLYKEVARATLDFVLREMTSEPGGFYSALDADSERPDKPGEHAEGAYYLWSETELRVLLSGDEFDFAKRYYAIAKNGNIESDPHDEFSNLNVLHVDEQYEKPQLTKKERVLREAVKEKLLAQRKLRPQPHLDDKIITAWNGMMISALVKASVVFDDKKYRHAAIKAAKFIRDRLIDNQTGELMRRYRNQQAGIEAGLSDYAWYMRAVIDVYGITKDKDWLQLALALGSKQDELFLDEKGGYFDTSNRDNSVLFRTRSAVDGALPAANAVVLANLVELYGLTGKKHWKLRADRLLESFAGTINSAPSSSAMMLFARP